MSLRETALLVALGYVLYTTRPLMSDLETYCKGYRLNLLVMNILVCSNKLVIGACNKVYIVDNIPYLSTFSMLIPYLDNISTIFDLWLNTYQMDRFNVVAFKPVWSDTLYDYIEQVNVVLDKIAHQIHIQLMQPKWYEWVMGLKWEDQIRDILWVSLLSIIIYFVSLVLRRRLNLIFIAFLTLFFGSTLPHPLNSFCHLNVFNYMANISFIYNLGLEKQRLILILVFLTSTSIAKQLNPVSTPTIGTMAMESFVMGYYNNDIIDLSFGLIWTICVKYGLSSLMVGIPFDSKLYFQMAFTSAITGIVFGSFS